MQDGATFWIPGLPATFATKGEKPWRQTVNSALAGYDMIGHGLVLKFVLPSWDPWKQKADVDNFCEPVFSEIINRLGWLGGRRPNLLWWHAEKQFSERPGVQITFQGSRVPPPGMLGKQLVFDGTYSGELPKSATAPEMPDWLSSAAAPRPSDEQTRLGVELHFGSEAVNIGNIASGTVKSVIDCLYPIIGGQKGAPDDWKIDQLRVSKGIAAIGTAVNVRVWNL